MKEKQIAELASYIQDSAEALVENKLSGLEIQYKLVELGNIIDRLERAEFGPENFETGQLADRLLATAERCRQCFLNKLTASN